LAMLLGAVLSVRHHTRLRNILCILCLMALLGILFYLFKTAIYSNVSIL
jgi:hypothetical protein